MKKYKIFRHTLIMLVASFIVFSAPSSAATQTVILKPTSAKLGVIKAYIGSDFTNPFTIVSNGGTDLSNVLTEDGQFALLDPSLPGPTEAAGIATTLAIDYEKNAICPQASIEEVIVHSIWKTDREMTSPSSAAVLAITEDYQDSSSVKLLIDNSNMNTSFISSVFGGLINSGGLEEGTFSGLVSTNLTHDSSVVQKLPTLADLNNPNSRIIVNMGQTEPELITGLLDHVYLEVDYDDSNCSPTSIDPSTISPPKTGAALTAGIIIAGLLALTGTSLFGVKRTKLKHRNSERE